MARCTAPVRGHATAAGAASCPVHGGRFSPEQVAPLPVVTSPSLHVVPLPDGGQREQWQVEGRYHRTDGPAVVVRNAAGVVVLEEWFVEDHRHRTDGPAVVKRNAAGVVTYEVWWADGRLHRTDGPAWVERNDAGVVTLERWWVEGETSTPGEVLGVFLAERGVAGLSPEALEYLASTRPYEQWSSITNNEADLARMLFPATEVRL